MHTNAGRCAWMHEFARMASTSLDTDTNRFTSYYGGGFEGIWKHNWLLTSGEQNILSWLHDLVVRLTWPSVLLLGGVILKQPPIRVFGENKCRQVSVKVVPSESAILPEPCIGGQRSCEKKSKERVYQRWHYHSSLQILPRSVLATKVY